MNADPFDLPSVEDPEDDWEIPDYDMDWVQLWWEHTFPTRDDHLHTTDWEGWREAA
jgi:hypothetical protein